MMRRWIKLFEEAPADAFEDEFWATYDRWPHRQVTKISLHQHKPDVVEISHISVDAASRGRGLANKLLGFLCDLANRHAITLLAAPATDADGETGLDTAGLIDWYGRWGFESVGGGMLLMRREPFDEVD